MNHIIGITGFKRNGKDTCARYFQKELGYASYSFALPLKKALCEIFGWDLSIFESDLKDVVDPYWGVSPRVSAQTIGTEWAQFTLGEFSPMFSEITGRKIWVKKFVKLFNEKPQNYVISDMRFLHEAEGLRELQNEDTKVTLIRVTRPSIIFDATSLHASEVDIPNIKVDFEVTNHGTMDDLYNTLSLLYEADKIRLLR